MCSDSVLILKMIPLAFHFYHCFPTRHTDNFKRILLGPTTAHSHVCQKVSLCVLMCACVLTTMRAFGQRNLVCWNQNIPGDTCNSPAILDGGEAFFLLPIQCSGKALNKAGCLICWVTAIRGGGMTAYYFSEMSIQWNMSHFQPFTPF